MMFLFKTTLNSLNKGFTRYHTAVLSIHLEALKNKIITFFLQQKRNEHCAYSFVMEMKVKEELVLTPGA